MAGADDDAAPSGWTARALQPRSRTHARVGRWCAGAGAGPAGDAASGSASGWPAFFDDVDVLLTPVTAGPPLPARPWHERSFLANVTANARWAPWAAPWNLAGLPALVLPAGTRPGRAARRRSSSSAPRVPKRGYSGWPESWSGCSRGAGTPRSSTPPPTAAPPDTAACGRRGA